VLRFAVPGTDQYVVEGYAFELTALLQQWSRRLIVEPPATETMVNFIDSSMQSTTLVPVRESAVRSGDPIEVVRREFAPGLHSGRERLIEQIKIYLSPFNRIETADFEIYECQQVSDSPLTLAAKIQYDFVGTRNDNVREERIGSWRTEWSRNESGAWRALKWIAAEETNGFLSAAVGSWN
jgi:hypothetical protein